MIAREMTSSGAFTRAEPEGLQRTDCTADSQMRPSTVSGTCAPGESHTSRRRGRRSGLERGERARPDSCCDGTAKMSEKSLGTLLSFGHMISSTRASEALYYVVDLLGIRCEVHVRMKIPRSGRRTNTGEKVEAGAEIHARDQIIQLERAKLGGRDDVPPVRVRVILDVRVPFFSQGSVPFLGLADLLKSESRERIGPRPPGSRFPRHYCQTDPTSQTLQYRRRHLHRHLPFRRLCHSHCPRRLPISYCPAAGEYTARDIIAGLSDAGAAEAALRVAGCMESYGHGKSQDIKANKVT